MKLKSMVLPIILGFSFASGTTIAHGEEVTNSKKQAVEYQNKENIQVEKNFSSFSEAPSDEISTQALAIYNITKTSFGSEIWIRDKYAFINPKDIQLDFGSVKSVTFSANSGGKEYYSQTFKNFQGGINIPLMHLPRGKSYQFKLVNESPGTKINLSGGFVEFNYK